MFFWLALLTSVVASTYSHFEASAFGKIWYMAIAIFIGGIALICGAIESLKPKETKDEESSDPLSVGRRAAYGRLRDQRDET